MKGSRLILIFWVGVLLSGPAASAAEPRPIDGFSDHSFLIEEAYNQERGEVQHILKALYSKDSRRPGWSFAVEQEWWLFNEDHQLSFSIPFFRLRDEGKRQRGVGDIAVAYRYQLAEETASVPAVAPKFGLIFPTGNRNEGTGDGVVGYEWSLAASKKVASRWAVHANLGLTYLPKVRARLDDPRRLSPKRSLVSYDIGASTVLALSSNIHLLLEWVGELEQGIDDRGKKERDFKAILSPGIRAAIVNQERLQTVVGIGIPVGVSRAADKIGALLYLSVEHKLF
ncbi:MAG TPA: transporter [candidate division Zixibacteria bacterium]|nr:transporter [candidate division Zixibacteria bacterium]